MFLTKTSTSGNRLVILNDIYQDQMDIERPVVQVPRPVGDVLVDPLSNNLHKK